MTKIFYDHLIIKEEIHLELDKYHLSVDEREELHRLIDEMVHHRVLDTILTHLPAEKHDHFLANLYKTPHDEKLLAFLKAEIAEDIETKIREEGEKIKKEILSEIKRSRKR